MPRISRNSTHVPGALVHVICRFVDGRFVLDDDARDEYLRLLAQALGPTDWSLVSYALMSSHVHLGFLGGASLLRDWALPLHVRFAQRINRGLRSTNPKVLGHVFGDRPTTKVMCTSRARLLIAYHHRNPVRAGVTDDVVASRWTSHQDYAGLRAPRGGLDVRLGLELAGFPAGDVGRQALHEFVSRTQVSLSELRPLEMSPETRPIHQVAVKPQPMEIVRRVARLIGESLANIRRVSRMRTPRPRERSFHVDVNTGWSKAWTRIGRTWTASR